MRRKGRTRARTFRPSSPFPLEWRRPSCRMMIIACRERRRGADRAAMTVPPARLVKHGDEHRRNILKHVLRFRSIENGGVLPKLVRDLVNDKPSAVRQRFVGFFQERA